MRVGAGESVHKDGESHYRGVLDKLRSAAFVSLEQIMSIASLKLRT